MEKAYYQVIQDQPVDEFERRFVESYPYYSALTENAIQYLVDTELDEDPKAEDAGTICHERFLTVHMGEGNMYTFPISMGIRPSAAGTLQNGLGNVTS